MDEDNDRDYFKAKQVGATPKAIQVALDANGKRFWIPRSVCEWHRDGILMVERWFSKKEGMI